MEMPKRYGNSWSYKYGCQGSEKNEELKGEGNSYTTFYRQLDPCLGRWFSVDPKTATTPWESPYMSMGNNPVWRNGLNVYGEGTDGGYSSKGKVVGSVDFKELGEFFSLLQLVTKNLI